MRPDLAAVAALVPTGSRVLDLGCGDGELLAALDARGCRGTGVEIDGAAFLAAVARGVPVLALDLDRDLDVFADDSYDVVVLSQTLQTLRAPARVLRDVARIAPLAVVSTPNLAWWRHRLALLGGRMPVPPELPHSWYDDPDIHLSTLPALEQLFAATGLRVRRRVLLDARGAVARRALRPTLLAPGAAYLLARVPPVSPSARPTTGAHP